jgi:hypothetical protein
MRAFLIAAALFLAQVAQATGEAASHRYSLTGTGTLRADPPVQADGKLTLRATLHPKDAALAAQPPVQEGGRFALMAAVKASAGVCYNDTIFRDDFDGDGF